MATYYLDMSASNDGDGTTSAQAGSPGGVGAYKTLNGKTFANGDIIYSRRVSGTLDASWTLSNKVSIIGWPISGDPLYATRPSNATWDADSATYSTWTSTSTRTVTLSENIIVHRIKFSTPSNHAMVVITTAYYYDFLNCYFESTVAGATTCIISNQQLTSSRIKNCTFTYSNAASGHRLFSVGSYNLIINIQITATGTATGNYGFEAATANYIYDVSVTYSATSTADGPINIQNYSFVENFTYVGIGTGANTFSGNYVNFKGMNLTGLGDVTFSGPSGNYEFVNLQSTGTITISSAANRFKFTALKADFLTITGEENYVHIDTFTLNDTTSGTEVISCALGSYVSIKNHAALTNFFKTTSPGGGSVSSNIYRSGGASYSIKMTPVTMGLTFPVSSYIGFKNLESIQVSIGSSGSKTVTVYCAYKGFSTGLTQGDIFLLGTYTYNGTIYHVDTCNSIGPLTSDSSTWNNDSNLTKFKMAFTFTAPAAITLNLVIRLQKWLAASYVYIDPTAVVS